MLVYEIFIAHFIEMAQMSYKFHAYNQSLIFLKQASRLCSLLLEDDRPCEVFMGQIDAIHRDVMSERGREHQDHQVKPQLPRRESSMEISNKIKFRIKMSRTNPENIEDPYTNIEFIKQQMQTNVNNNQFAVRNPNETESDDEPTKDYPVPVNNSDGRSPRFNRYLAPAVKPQLKRQKSCVTTTVQVHSKQSPKSPRTPIKCVNFFDDADMSSGNNSPAIKISQFGDGDVFKRVNQESMNIKQNGFSNKLNGVIDCDDGVQRVELLVEKEHINFDINKKIRLKTDLIMHQSDSGIGDHTEL